MERSWVRFLAEPLYRVLKLRMPTQMVKTQIQLKYGEAARQTIRPEWYTQVWLPTQRYLWMLTCN